MDLACQHQILIQCPLRRLRKDRGISQFELADFVKIDRSFLSDIERGLNSQSLGTICAISEYLRIEPHELLAEMSKEILIQGASNNNAL